MIRTPAALLAMLCLVLAISANALPVGATEQTVGLFLNEPGASPGYTLFTAMRYETTYLIDKEGRLVHSWDSELLPGLSTYLLENGNLIRAAATGTNTTFSLGGGGGGRIEEFTWDGSLVWEFEYSSEEYQLHHDFQVLPNGNVLMIAWEYKTGAEAIASGRDPALLLQGELWPDSIIEVQPTGASGGTIVWEWHVWDHLVQDFDPAQDNFGVVADHPELIDINFFETSEPSGGLADWNHTNSINYNEELDQIVLSVRNVSELWVIDHSTTTQESAGHSGGNSGKGGDLLYRWGNPQAYDAGDADDQKLFVQHNVQWIEPGLPGEGNLLMFNNGTGRPGGSYSSVDEIVPPVDDAGNYVLATGQPYGPEEPIWTYAAPNPADFYSFLISGTHRLPNGNTFIDHGMFGDFFEVTPAGETVWRYVNPVTKDGPQRQGDYLALRFGAFQTNLVFRATVYRPDYPGLQGRDLTPGDVIELEKATPTLTATPETTPTPVPTATAPPGDADGDGVVTSLDALIVLQHSAGLLPAVPSPSGADVNGDGDIGALDAALILQFTAGLLSELSLPA